MKIGRWPEPALVDGAGDGAILVSIGAFPDNLLKALARRTGMRVAPGRMSPESAWNSGRGQYNSSRLIEELKARFEGVVIGATPHDLFIPVLTFVFGEAELGGRAAVFSIHRLREEFYGLPRNDALVESRALRELRHEAGHVWGLPHCVDWSCVMSSSHSVERVDVKGERFCAECLARAGARRTARR